MTDPGANDARGVAPRWGAFAIGNGPGVRRWHGDPRLCCATPLGSIAIVRPRWECNFAGVPEEDVW